MREACRALGAFALALACALANPSAADELDAEREALLRSGFEAVPGLAVGAFDADGTSIGYRTMGSGPPMLLIHGFPETGRAWAHVAERLAAEHALIVPDYRGACASDVPAGGYDKATMAEDLHALVASLGHESVHVVGHDIGMMVAFAYAANRPEAVRTLAPVEGILPGTRAFDDVVASGAVWHFGLHENVDFAVELISGRPRVYFDHFWFGPVVGRGTPIGDAALAQYRDCHDSPDEIRGAVLPYSTFEADGEANARAIASGAPDAATLLVAGEASVAGPMRATAAELPSAPRVEIVPGVGHFIAEAAPDALAALLREHAGADAQGR